MTANASRYRQYLLDFIIFITMLLYLCALGLKALEFGAKKGGWFYPYLHSLTFQPLLYSGIGFIIFIVLVAVCKKYLREQQFISLVLFFLLFNSGVFTVPSLTPSHLGEIVLSDSANGFYTVAIQHTFGECLSDFDAVSSNIPLHARSNMPGKILFYKMLLLITTSPSILGVLIVVISNTGCFLMYYISLELFRQKDIAFYAGLFYLLFPARIYFFPLLNTISPFLLLASLSCMLLYLGKPQRKTSISFAILVFCMFLFDPLLFASGLVFIALLLMYVVSDKIYGMKLFEGALSFLITISLVTILLGSFYDFWIFSKFWHLLFDAMDFNVGAERGYWIWFWHNLKDFILGAGIASIVCSFAIIYSLLTELLRTESGTISKATRISVLTRPEYVITISAVLSVLILNLMGINRGEVIRLWIFLMIFFQMSAAFYCIRKGRWLTVYLLVLSDLLSIFPGLHMIGFIVVQKGFIVQ